MGEALSYALTSCPQPATAAHSPDPTPSCSHYDPGELRTPPVWPQQAWLELGGQIGWGERGLDSLQLYVCLGELWIYYKKQTPNIKTVDAIVFSRELSLQDAQQEELAERTLMWKLTREAGGGEGKKQGSSLPRNSLRFPSGSTLCAPSTVVKNRLPRQETQETSWPLGGEDPLEEEMATHSRVLAWETPWTEVPGGLQSVGLQSRTRLNSLNNKEVESGTAPTLSWQLPDL